MTRPKLLIAGLSVVVVLLAGITVLRDSGLATSPGRALAAMPHGTVFSPRTAPTGKFTVTMQGGRVEWEGEYGNVVDNMIYHFGVYEKGEVTLLRKMLGAMGGSFLDVGANFGNHSLWLSDVAEKVHAIEPWPPAVVRMRRELEVNPDITNVVVHPVGYSNEPGTLPFYVPPDGSFVVGTFDPTFLGLEGRKEIPLPLVTGDAHLAEVGAGRIGVMKVDIEGFERYAFIGLKDTLTRDRPAVLFEVNVTEGGFSSMEQLQQTFPPDYEFWEIELDPPWLLDFVLFGWFYGSEATGRYHLEPMTDFHRTNALALPKERDLLPSLR
ncbi:MAG: FkbM family methyltransferase [Alphaproteobacteria bacterium]|nr:FkbM family methyltransferase [Alphaproteobacteria bacterium]MCB9695227.1 FkbM family methyltransferase [Alphaproteobacteria bacterium]